MDSRCKQAINAKVVVDATTKEVREADSATAKIEAPASVPWEEEEEVPLDDAEEEVAKEEENTPSSLSSDDNY